jgi:Mrp family chromosome partitioning ATPase
MFAADGKAALVIEANLRRARPVDSGIDDDGPDLRDVLQGLSDWHDAVRLVPAPLGEFHVLMANDVGPAELLSGAAMRNLMSDVSSYYDVVLLDVSSFPQTSDALMLAPLADCMISVVRLRSTHRRSALAHFRELNRGIPHALVLNDLEPAIREREKVMNTSKEAAYAYTEPLSQVTVPVECLVTSPQGEPESTG